MSKIENMVQLRLEIIRLQSVKAQQELIIKNNFQEVNESLKPGNLFKSIVSSAFADKKDNKNLLMYGINQGLNYWINFFAEKAFLKDKPEIIKILGRFLLNNIASKMVSFKSDSLLGRITSFFNFGKSKTHGNGSTSHMDSRYNNPPF